MFAELVLYLIAGSTGYLAYATFRRGSTAQRGYLVLLLGELGLVFALLASGRVQGPLWAIAIGSFVALVVVPALLRGATRRALSQDRIDIAVRLTAVRELFQPMAGVRYEREVLAALDGARLGRAAEAVALFRRRLEHATNTDVQSSLHEQIVTVLVYGRAWQEGIAEFERHLGPAYAAARPALAAHLIRAYCEAGNLERAAELLHTLETGPAAHDLAALAVMNHARLTYLAFVGSPLCERLLDEKASFLPGLPPRLRFLWLGIARARAGCQAEAGEALVQAQGLSTADVRVHAAATAELERLRDGSGASLVPAELADFTQAVSERALAVGSLPVVPRGLRRWPVTFALLLANVAVWLALEALGSSQDPASLIAAGANFKVATRGGEYFRLVAAMFIHIGPLHLALNCYALYVLGRFVEQTYGSTRAWLIYFAAGLAGNLASLLLSPGPLSAGASGAVFGLMGAGVVALIQRRGTYPEAWRRSVLGNFLFVIALNLFLGFRLAMIDNAAHVGGLVGGVLVGWALIQPVARAEQAGSATRRRPPLALAALVAVSLAALVYTAASVASSAGQPAAARIPWVSFELRGITLSAPRFWELRGKQDGKQDPEYLQDPTSPVGPTLNVAVVPLPVGPEDSAVAAEVARQYLAVAAKRPRVHGARLASPPEGAAARGFSAAAIRFALDSEERDGSGGSGQREETCQLIFVRRLDSTHLLLATYILPADWARAFAPIIRRTLESATRVAADDESVPVPTPTKHARSPAVRLTTSMARRRPGRNSRSSRASYIGDQRQ